MINLENECCICLESNNYSCYTTCNHLMCVDCLISLIKMECPICRKNLESELSSKIKNIIIKNSENKNINNNTNIINYNDYNEFPPPG